MASLGGPARTGRHLWPKPSARSSDSRRGHPIQPGKGCARRAPGRGLTCSVPTKLWPRRRASSWASMTTLMAFSVKRCWRGGGGGRVQKVRAVRLAVPRWFFFPSRGLDRGRFRVASTRATRSDARIHARDGCTHTQGTMFSNRFRVRTVEWTIGVGLTGRTSNMALVTKRRPRPERPANPRV